MTTSRSDPAVIHIAAAVVVDERGHTLLVRKRGTEAFMQAGGKVGAGETAVDALDRELREELGCGARSEYRLLGSFTAPAANEPGSMVRAELFSVELAGDVVPAAEIEEALWHDPDSTPAYALAPLTRDHVLPLVRQWRHR
jgi:8-oxo-dGTP pyrophosphatase MutT (NUDIX family)